MQRYCDDCGTPNRQESAFCVGCGRRLGGVQRSAEKIGSAVPTGASASDEGGGRGPRATDTTRYLCAAAYQDRAFRDRVIEQVIEERHRAIGPSYGVDLGAVTRHCLIARSLQVRRDVLLTGLFLLMVLLFLFQPAFALLPFLGVLIVVLMERWFVDSAVVSNFSKGNFDGKSVRLPFGNGFQDTAENRLFDIAHEQDGNVVTYSGYSPFVGSGFDLGGWSFTLRTDKGKEEVGITVDATPFDLEDLYGHVTDDLTSLGLDGLEITDKLYVDGQEIRTDKRFLRDPLAKPLVKLEPRLVRSFVGKPARGIRYYKSIHAVEWGGELILSIFVRFEKIENNLYAEVIYFLVPPVKERYHEVDNINPTLSLRRLLGVLSKAVASTPVVLVLAPIRTLGHALSPYRLWRRERQARRLIDMNLAYDYGAKTSVRESAASSHYRRYFQKLDQEMNLKVLEQRILDAIIEFLDDKNINTSDLKDRQQTILNEGVIVSGGSVQAESIAVGKGAMSRVSRLAGEVSRLAGETRQQDGRAQPARRKTP